MSIKQFFPGSRSQGWFRVGPLACDLDAFGARLAALGYATGSARQKLRFIRNLSHWMAGHGMEVEALDEGRIEAFLKSRKPGYRHHGEAATARLLLSHLRDHGRIPPVPEELGSEDPIRVLLCRYERFLVEERGLSSATVKGYVPIVKAFLTERFGGREVALRGLTVRDCNRFILCLGQGISRSTSKLHVTALRSFLRYLYRCGDITVDLAGGILPVMNWRLPGMPKTLTPGEVHALLDSCDCTTVLGRRDYAILLMLARLGLRPGEVVAMSLDDLDWNNGNVTVSGKGKRREQLPLPHDVGEALAAYLRDGRPRCSTRRLFVGVRAPHRPFQCATAIDCVVRRALARAELDPPFKGAYLLRHTLATQMLRNGASLEDIGQILRHRHPETTQIYAKLDLDSLRSLAAVWPGGAP